MLIADVTTRHRGIWAVHRLSMIIAVVAIISLTGCSDGPDYPHARLAGRITVDEQVIPDGTMMFSPMQPGAGPIVNTKVVDGNYVAEAVPLGKIHVEILAIKESGKMVPLWPHDPDGAKVKELVNVIPISYRNGIEIEVDGDNDSQNFALSTSRSPKS